MVITLRLEFSHIFPNETKYSAEEYLKQVSKETLSECIGFFSIAPKIDWHNFFSNAILQRGVSTKINHIRSNGFPNICVTSMQGMLRIQELILSNRKTLLKDNVLDTNTDRDEMNLFKTFLVINEDLNKDEGLLSANYSNNSMDEIVEMAIALKFADSDLNMYEDYEWELLKLSFVTLYKFEKLIDFLLSKQEYNYLLNDLCKYYKQDSVDKLKRQVYNLLLNTHRLLNKKATAFNLEEEDKETIDFLDSLTSFEIDVIDDYVSLRNYPLYKKSYNEYIIINHFFILDKFTKSTKFLLKTSYENHSKKNFFSWFNEEFSEKFLMKNLLDSIFYKKYFIKKLSIYNNNNEPDYYIRHNRDVYLFEHKDILIAKEVKISRDIEEIKSTLKEKLFIKKKGDWVGIGQLIKHIQLISEGAFQYDSEFHKSLKHTYNIYPILLLSDRVLEVPGINYMLNQWFREELNNRKLSSKLKVKDLVIIDIDTMAFTQFYLIEKDKNFKERIDIHIKKMREKRKVNEDNFLKKLGKNNLLPYSYRFGQEIFRKQSVRNKFEKFLYPIFNINQT